MTFRKSIRTIRRPTPCNNSRCKDRGIAPGNRRIQETATMPLTNVQTRDVEALLHPYTALHTLRDTGPLVLDHGKGVHVYDTHGKAYIEGMSGLWCAGLGFGDEELIAAAKEQLDRLPYYHLFGGKSMEPAIELAEKLKELAPFEASKVFFTSSGSEANDTQVKLAWYYNNARGRPQKKKIISRVKAYHGVTIVAASLTGLPNNHRDFDPAGGPDPAHRLPACLSLRGTGRGRRRLYRADRRQSARHDRTRGPGNHCRLHRRTDPGCWRRHRTAGGLLPGGAGASGRTRHPVHRRRGDQRLRAHRQLVGLRDHGLHARYDLLRQAADVCLRSARRRHGGRGDV
jgi:hypothetical protein